MFVCVAAWIVLLHVAEMTEWTLVYAWGGAIAGGVQAAAYFSAVTYTTTGYGDLLSFRGFLTNEDMRFGRLSYVIPAGHYGTRIGASVAAFDYELAKDFAATGANGEGQVYTLYALHPLLRTRNANLFLQAGLESKRLEDQFDSASPVEKRTIDAGKLVDDDYAMEDGLWFESAPGHTPGNVVIHARSRDDRAVFLGDVLHHQFQLMQPAWSTLACSDPALSRATRMRLVEEYADQTTRLLPGHFPAPTTGRIVRRGNAYRYAFE